VSTPPLILVSNRGPVTFRRTDEGDRVGERGGGGLVTALVGLVEHTPALWISAALTDEDHAIARETGGRSFEIPGFGVDTRGRFVTMDERVYDRYYNQIANPLLWFIQHYLWDLSNHPDIRREELEAWDEGYLVANRAFADAIVDELDARPGAVVMLHDYHLYIAPEHVRTAHPTAFLHLFCHIPWSQPDYWRVLPPHIREHILRGLLACDIVAFHTRRYARNFLLCCEDILDIRVDYDRSEVEWEGRTVWVRSYPISVNAPMFEELAESDAVRAHEAGILRRRRAHLVVRVDRTDLSKNILRGFKAYDTFLEEHPEYHEQVTFVAFLQPTRQDVVEYATYLDKIRQRASYINTRHGNTDWMPIELRIESDLARAVALYKHYDVLLVNAVFDGMNLVAKEAPLVNERDGVVILSENAGAHEEIGSFALSVNPFDVRAQAEAIHQALSMPSEERRLRAEQIRRVVRENDVAKWLSHQQTDIEAKGVADGGRGGA
jgi:trehalose 6-phosphate synthase